MKIQINLLLAAAGVCGLLLSAAAQPAAGNADTNSFNAPEAAAPPDMTPMTPASTPASAEAAPATNPPVESTVILPKGNAPEAVASPFAPPAQAVGTNNSNALQLNFRNAPLEMVLNYLGDAAGFIIVQDTHVSGTVTVTSTHPVSQDEAVNLLNTELNRNNYAAIRDGRTLTIVDKSDAKTRNIPVKTGNKPGDIPNNDEIATWIIPIRFVEARQLVSDLSTFVSPQATIVANEAGNSVVVTDTQSNIHHLAEIIQAVDNSAEAETQIRVFRLKYASPTDVANELGSVFPSNSSGNTQSPIQFRGPGGFPFGGFGNRGGNNSSTSSSSDSDRIRKATQVTAVADARIQAVIVTAPKDLMDQIASMMTDLDVPSDRDQSVYVFQMMNGDPQQAVTVLQNMFQSGSTSRSGTSSSSSQNSALQQRAQNGTTTMGSTTTSSGTGGSSIGGGSSGRSAF